MLIGSCEVMLFFSDYCTVFDCIVNDELMILILNIINIAGKLYKVTGVWVRL